MLLVLYKSEMHIIHDQIKMEEPKLEMNEGLAYIDLWSRPCNMGCNGYLFLPLPFKVLADL